MRFVEWAVDMSYMHFRNCVSLLSKFLAPICPERWEGNERNNDHLGLLNGSHVEDGQERF